MKWEHAVTIDAPAERVWTLTVDVETLPSVTPTVTSVLRLDEGPLALGKRTRLKQPGQAAAVWTVTRFEPTGTFAWQTKRLWLTMVGTHRIEDLGDSCRNTLSLELTGPGARLLGALIGKSVLKAISTENAGFKAVAEAVPEGSQRSDS
jgi:uncharacterized membrane protein